MHLIGVRRARIRMVLHRKDLAVANVLDECRVCRCEAAAWNKALEQAHTGEIIARMLRLVDVMNDFEVRIDLDQAARTTMARRKSWSHPDPTPLRSAVNRIDHKAIEVGDRVALVL